MFDGPMFASRRLLRRVVCGVSALVLVAGDLAAVVGRAAAADSPLLLAQAEMMRPPVNPCAVRQQEKKKDDPGVPPSVGRDRIERLLRDRQRQDDQMPQEPTMQQPRAPADDSAIGRIGEQLRKNPIPVPPGGLAGVAPGGGGPG